MEIRTWPKSVDDGRSIRFVHAMTGKKLADIFYHIFFPSTSVRASIFWPCSEVNPSCPSNTTYTESKKKDHESMSGFPKEKRECLHDAKEGPEPKERPNTVPVITVGNRASLGLISLAPNASTTHGYRDKNIESDEVESTLNWCTA